jgi:hypothetical protein
MDEILKPNPIPLDPRPFTCDKCSEAFDTKAQLNGHKAGKHSRRSGRTFTSREERLAARRAYQHERRDMFYRTGRNSRGEKMPPGWKPGLRVSRKPRYPSDSREYRQRKYREYKARKLTNNSTAPVANPLGDAAAAVINAAQVLRAVAAGMRIQ